MENKKRSSYFFTFSQYIFLDLPHDGSYLYVKTWAQITARCPKKTVRVTLWWQRGHAKHECMTQATNIPRSTSTSYHCLGLRRLRSWTVNSRTTSLCRVSQLLSAFAFAAVECGPTNQSVVPGSSLGKRPSAGALGHGPRGPHHPAAPSLASYPQLFSSGRRTVPYLSSSRHIDWWDLFWLMPCLDHKFRKQTLHSKCPSHYSNFVFI